MSALILKTHSEKKARIIIRFFSAEPLILVRKKTNKKKFIKYNYPQFQIFRSDLANGTFAVFFFPCEWSHCLFHTFGLNTTFRHRIVASSGVWWLQCSASNHRTRVRFVPEVRMRGMEDYRV